MTAIFDTQANGNLLKVFGEGIVSDRTCRKWFKKFETANFDLSDKLCSGQPSLIDDDVVKTMLVQHPFLTISDFAERLSKPFRIIFGK